MQGQRKGQSLYTLLKVGVSEKRSLFHTKLTIYSIPGSPSLSSNNVYSQAKSRSALSSIPSSLQTSATIPSRHTITISIPITITSNHNLASRIQDLTFSFAAHGSGFDIYIHGSELPFCTGMRLLHREVLEAVYGAGNGWVANVVLGFGRTAATFWV